MFGRLASMADSLCGLVRTVWEKMRLAGEAGSLPPELREDLQDAIHQGQGEWEERLPLFRFTEYGLSEKPRGEAAAIRPGRYRGRADHVLGQSGRTGTKSTRRVRELRLERRSFLKEQLFVEDAKQGLGFVDLCSHRYDVVLMNPPFGASSKPTKHYLESEYPHSRSSIYTLPSWKGHTVG